jgi:Protein of unknown function (DUF3117)
MDPDWCATDVSARQGMGSRRSRRRVGAQMAAMKPRTGDGPLEVTKEGRGLVMRVPLEGGGRLVVELNADEAKALEEALSGVTS